MASGLILLPTYNERENLGPVLERIRLIASEMDVIVIDDDSPDGTGELAEKLTGTYPRLSVLHRRSKEGLGRAYVHGMKEAIRRGYSRIVTMDADLSHAPEDVPRLVAALESSSISIGSRHVPGGGVEDWPATRKALSSVGSFYARSVLGCAVRDMTSGFRAYRAEALRAIDLDSVVSRGFVFQVEILQRVLDLPGATAAEVPIVFRNRAVGKSKLSTAIVVEATIEVLRLRARRCWRQQRPEATPWPVDGPSLTAIVPQRPEEPEAASVAALQAQRLKISGAEVLVARGFNPSLQRNAAANLADGDVLVFFDDDSEPSPGLLQAYRSAFERHSSLGVLGGPSIYEGQNRFGQVAAALLSDPMVTGKSAARYWPRGTARRSDERELILSNLAIRASAFRQVGGFDEALYPNEENDLLERIARNGWHVFYSPALSISRPAPNSPTDLISKVFRYGRGRALQARRCYSFSSQVRALSAICWLIFLAAILCWSVFSQGTWYVPLTPLVAYGVILAFRVFWKVGMISAFYSPIIAATIHCCYAIGILSGFITKYSAFPRVVTVEKVLQGHRIKSNFKLDSHQ